MPDLTESRTQFSTQTLSHSSNLSEQDTLEFIALKNHIRISMDISSFVQELTVRTYEKVDGTSYQQLNAKVFPTDYDESTETIVIIFDGGGHDMKFTLESTNIVEGATRTPTTTIRETTRK